jgi:hypothetical protein
LYGSSLGLNVFLTSFETSITSNTSSGIPVAKDIISSFKALNTFFFNFSKILSVFFLISSAYLIPLSPNKIK